MRWSVAPAALRVPAAARSAGFSKNDPSRRARSMRRRSWGTIRPGAERQVADLGVAHDSGRQAHGFSRSFQQRPGVFGEPPVEDRRAGERDGVPVGGRRVAPAVADQEEDRRGLQAKGAGRGGSARTPRARCGARQPALEVGDDVHEGHVGLVGRLVGREVRVHVAVGRALGRHVVEVVGRREPAKVAPELLRGRRPDARFQAEQPLQGVLLQVVALPGGDVARLVGPRQRAGARTARRGGEAAAIASEGVRKLRPAAGEVAARPSPRRTRRCRSPSTGARRRSRSP